MESKFFNTQILKYLKMRISSQTSSDRHDGVDMGDTYVVFTSTTDDRSMNATDVKRHLRNLFVHEDEDKKSLDVFQVQNTSKFTKNKLRRIIMGKGVPESSDDFSEMSTSRRRKEYSKVKEHRKRVEALRQLSLDSGSSDSSISGTSNKTRKRISKSESCYSKTSKCNQSGLVFKKEYTKTLKEQRRNMETLRQLSSDSMCSDSSVSGTASNIRKKLRKSTRRWNANSQSSMAKTTQGGRQQFKPNVKQYSRQNHKVQQRDYPWQSNLPSDLYELEQLLHKFTFFKENRQLGGTVDFKDIPKNLTTPLEEQILNVIVELETLIRNWKQRPVNLSTLFWKQARLSFRRHILGCAIRTWNDLSSILSLQIICCAVRSCVALLKTLFEDNNHKPGMCHQYNNEDDMTPTLLGPGVDEPLVVIIDRLYYAYLWLFNPRYLQRQASSHNV